MITIRSVRKARGLSRAELAHAAGCGEEFVERLELGIAGRPSDGLTSRLARALRVPKRDLLEGQSELSVAAKALKSAEVVMVASEIAEAGLNPSMKSKVEPAIWRYLEVYSAKFGDTAPPPGAADPSRGIEGQRIKGGALDQLTDILGKKVAADGHGNIVVFDQSGDKIEAYVDIVQFVATGEVIVAPDPIAGSPAQKRDVFGRSRPSPESAERDVFGLRKTKPFASAAKRTIANSPSGEVRRDLFGRKRKRS